MHFGISRFSSFIGRRRSVFEVCRGGLGRGLPVRRGVGTRAGWKKCAGSKGSVSLLLGGEQGIRSLGEGFSSLCVFSGIVLTYSLLGNISDFPLCANSNNNNSDKRKMNRQPGDAEESRAGVGEEGDQGQPEVIKVQLSVRMTCQRCVREIKELLRGVDGVSGVEVDLEREEVTLESRGVSPVDIVVLLEEEGGFEVIIRSLGSVKEGGEDKDQAAAVCILHADGGSDAISANSSTTTVMGVVRFLQISPGVCVVMGRVEGLSPGHHALSVHRAGNLSDVRPVDGSIGGHYHDDNSDNNTEEEGEEEEEEGGRGRRRSSKRRRIHAGDLGDIIAVESRGGDGDGVARFLKYDRVVKVEHLIGRSVAVYSDGEMDGCSLGGGDGGEKRKEGPGIVCAGIIARASGWMGNDKKVCACDGTTLWEAKKQQPLQ